MPNSLHPTILFHFTKTRETLFSILTHTFRVSYARETILGQYDRRDLGVPMVSFCDIKLRDIKDHIEKYGAYGIGLKKDWANSHGLNPVLYVNRQCELIGSLMQALTDVYNHIDRINEPKEYVAMSDKFTSIQNIYRYIKNYEGPLDRSGTIDPNYRFADEHEWRYVPPLTTQGLLPFVPFDKINTPEKKKHFNSNAEMHTLGFHPDDIRYLIVENENDIDELLNHLRIAKSRFPEEILSRLSSRILTTEQIKDDV